MKNDWKQWLNTIVKHIESCGLTLDQRRRHWTSVNPVLSSCIPIYLYIDPGSEEQPQKRKHWVHEVPEQQITASNQNEVDTSKEQGRRRLSCWPMWAKCLRHDGLGGGGEAISSYYCGHAGGHT